MSTDLLRRIADAARNSPEEEVCGLLFGAGEAVSSILACRNVAMEPARTFEIDPAALIAAHRQARAGGPALLGCYHSHPYGPAAPSRRDAMDAAPDGAFWLIAGEGTVTAWRATATGARHGRFDPVRFTCTADIAPPQDAD